MARVKGGRKTDRRRKLRKLAKGYRGARSREYRVMKEAVYRSLQYAYRDRRARKRDMRRLWIVRINAAARAQGLTYGQFIHGLRRANVALDRKVLAEMAVFDPQGFARLVDLAQQGLKA